MTAFQLVHDRARALKQRNRLERLEFLAREDEELNSARENDDAEKDTQTCK